MKIILQSQKVILTWKGKEAQRNEHESTQKIVHVKNKEEDTSKIRRNEN